jgi:hypothetical protein
MSECLLCYNNSTYDDKSCPRCEKTWCFECELKIINKLCPFCRIKYDTIMPDYDDFHYDFLVQNSIPVDFSNIFDSENDEETDPDSREIDYPSSDDDFTSDEE